MFTHAVGIAEKPVTNRSAASYLVVVFTPPNSGLDSPLTGSVPAAIQLHENEAGQSAEKLKGSLCPRAEKQGLQIGTCHLFP